MRIILSMTTSGRWPLFERTLRSMCRYITDLDLLGEILHLDDGSPEEERNRMRELFAELLPDVPLRPIADFQFLNRAHHARMMQMWHDLVSHADYVFHCEDDWEFISGGPLIGTAIELMQTEAALGQVGAWRKPPSEGLVSRNGIRFWDWPHDPTVRFIHRLQAEDEIDPAWPHFSLRPAVTRCEALRRVGNFQQERFFEHGYARRWTAAGFRTAFLAEKFCFHLAAGRGQSVYERLQTVR